MPSLAALYTHLAGESSLPVRALITLDDLPEIIQADFREINGQEHVSEHWKSLPRVGTT